MHHVHRTAAATILGLTCFVAAFGDEPEKDWRRWGGRGLQSVVMISLNEAVQVEIAATPQQKEQLTEILKKFAEARGPLAPDRPSPDPDRKPTAAEWAEHNRQVVDAHMKASQKLEPELIATLSVDQMKRLREILVQARGLKGLEDKETTEALQLTESQRMQVATIQAEFIRKLQDVFYEKSGLTDENQWSLAGEYEQARDAAMLEALTPEQSEQFTKLKGETFDLMKLRNGPFYHAVFGPRE